MVLLEILGFVSAELSPITKVVCLLLEALVLSLVLFDIRQRNVREGVRVPPGHLPVFGLLFKVIKLQCNNGFLQWVKDVSRDFDYQTWMLSAMGHHIIFTHTPEHIKHQMGTNFLGYVKGRKALAAFEPLLGHGIFTGDGMTWKNARSVYSHLFTRKQLTERMFSVFMRHSQALVSAIREMKEGETFDVQKLFFCFTFDTTNEIAFGRAVNSLGGCKRDREFLRAFDELQGALFGRIFHEAWRMMRFFNVGSERLVPPNVKIVDDYINKVVLERASEGMEEGDGKDLLTLFYEHCDLEGRSPTHDEVKVLVTNFVIAGRDTTASALTWGLYTLLKPENVHIKERLVEELSSVQPDAPAHYCQAFFQELERVHPGVPLEGKFAAADDVLPCGTKVPKGALVMFNPGVFGMNPEVFPEPDKFDPGRWLDKETGECVPYDMTGFSYPAFNAGPRVCLGRHMAALEFRLGMQAILPEFDFKPVDGFVPQELFTAVVQMVGGFPVTASPRRRPNTDG
eukprot:TRINITY_DN36038_c0_g1_i1.p1 TRINITY_DN36038_c0_g1~~TRINITY_DN36038_c0_g1_i1.p1  ORF type:complete len:512 (+),score=108.35 TRINITY_DN36038_c0_g1_i1:80-1615(+)